MEPIDPHTLIGKQVPAADGGDYGHLIVGYDERADDFLVVQIVWSTGEPWSAMTAGPRRIDRYKASYRYKLDEAR
jgi:hypothetical protein